MAKKTRLTEEQIRSILAEHAAGAAVGDLVKKHGFSAASFYNWKSRFGGGAAKSKRGRPKGTAPRAAGAAKTATASVSASTGDENQRLKVMVADLILERDTLRARLAGR